jgi:hypothetical protein
MDAVRALDDDALQLVESSIIPNLKAWGCVRATCVLMCCALPLPVPASSLHPTASFLKTSDCCPAVICPPSLQALCRCTPYFQTYHTRHVHTLAPIKCDDIRSNSLSVLLMQLQLCDNARSKRAHVGVAFDESMRTMQLLRNGLRQTQPGCLQVPFARVRGMNIARQIQRQQHQTSVGTVMLE